MRNRSFETHSGWGAAVVLAAAVAGMPNWIAFLTEADVLNWLWAQEGFDKEAIEDGLQTQIDVQKTPVTVSGTPWP